MDTNPLPNQDSDYSDSDPDELTNYVVRITSHGKFGTEQLLKFLQEESWFYRFVVGRETVPQEHFHIVLSVDQSKTEHDVRDLIKSFICPFWYSSEMKLPRGFGNKQYNLQISDDIDKAVSYAVKQSEYWSEGFEEQYLETRRAESFEKKKPSNFRSEYIELSTEFQSSDMDIRQFMVRFVKLKAKYGQQVVISQAYSYALSNLIVREPSMADEYVENYLYKQ